MMIIFKLSWLEIILDAHTGIDFYGFLAEDPWTLGVDLEDTSGREYTVRSMPELCEVLKNIPQIV